MKTIKNGLRNYSNIDGASTPNLDFLKTSLDNATKRVAGELGNVNFNLRKVEEWKNRRTELSKDFKDCGSNKCRDRVQGEERDADSRIASYQNEANSATKRMNAAKSLVTLYQQKIDKYQEAVESALSKGVTDGGSVEIAEIEVNKEVAALKNLQSKPMRTYALIGGVVVLGIAGFLIFRKK